MKYTIIYSCGHTQDIELFGKMSEREKKIEYLKKYGICKECYKKAMEEKEAKKPLKFNVKFSQSINEENGQLRLILWLDGNTKAYKEEIKKLGYKWNSSKFYWQKEIDVDDLQKETKKAMIIGATNIPTNKQIEEIMNYLKEE